MVDKVVASKELRQLINLRRTDVRLRDRSFNEQAINMLADRFTIVRDVSGIALPSFKEYLAAQKQLPPATGSSDDDWNDSMHEKVRMMRWFPRNRTVPCSILLDTCISLFVSVCSDVVRNDILSVLSAWGLFRNRSVSKGAFQDRCKELTGIAKKGGVRFHVRWSDFVDWDQFLGYTSVRSAPEGLVASTVDEWCVGDVVRTGTDDPDGEKYRTIYQQRAGAISDAVAKDLSTRSPIPLNAWILNTAGWVTSGSSKGVKAEVGYVDTHTGTVTDGGKSRSVKTAISQSMGLSEVRQLITKDAKDGEYSAALKIEPGGKYRLIISAPLQQQLRQGYVNSHVERGIAKACPWASMFYSEGRREKAEADMSVMSKRRAGLCHLPADASKFDRRVSKFEIVTVIDAIVEGCRQSGWSGPAYDEFMKICGTLTPDWFSKFHADGIEYMWEHGVPSGVRWTSMMDSVVNGLRFETCLTDLRDNYGVDVGVAEFMAQGDDMALVTDLTIDAMIILAWYLHYGFEIHPLKNQVSFRHDEFLRVIYDDGEVTGYLARRIVKLLYHDPIKAPVPNSLARVQERVKSLIDLVNRGADKERVLALATRQARESLAALGVQLDESEAGQYLHTPTPAGGCGVSPASHKMRGFEYRGRERFKPYAAPKGINAARFEAARARSGVEAAPELLSQQLGAALQGGDQVMAVARLNKRKVVQKPLAYLGKRPAPVNSATRKHGLPNWRAHPDLLGLPLEDIIRTAARRGDYNTLRELTDPALWHVFNIVIEKFDRGALILWLLDEWPGVAIIVPGESAVQFAKRSRVASAYVRNACLSRGHVTRRLIDELSVYACLLFQPVRL
uniref:RNA-directed RNA polymerase n=1 Tax=Beihai toti-like virus 5 TaxID=1922735 RepID=A0A1L3KFB5_9VIRU|nr:hypothetical protein 2 [Beihai toti-like virus 5]